MYVLFPTDNQPEGGLLARVALSNTTVPITSGNYQQLKEFLVEGKGSSTSLPLLYSMNRLERPMAPTRSHFYGEFDFSQLVHQTQPLMIHKVMYHKWQRLRAPGTCVPP